MSEFQILTLIRIEIDKFTYMNKSIHDVLLEIKRLSNAN